MNEGKFLLQTTKIGLVLSIACLGVLTGCAGFEENSHPPMADVQDDYIYYPNYECYYSLSRHEYAYREDNVWVSRRAPHGVSVSVLGASPAVKMNFHDSPANHDAEVVKQYPKGWKPTGASKSQDPANEQRNEHGN